MTKIRLQCRFEGCTRLGMSKGRGGDGLPRYLNICKNHRDRMRKERKTLTTN